MIAICARIPKVTTPALFKLAHYLTSRWLAMISVSSDSLSGTAGSITTRGMALKLRDGAIGGRRNVHHPCPEHGTTSQKAGFGHRSIAASIAGEERDQALDVTDCAARG